jgi:hypothetical protein
MIRNLIRILAISIIRLYAKFSPPKAAVALDKVNQLLDLTKLAKDSQGWFEVFKNVKGKLINSVHIKPPDTLVIIGAGAQENSWTPLYDCYGYPTPENPNPNAFIIQMLTRTVTVVKMNMKLLERGFDKTPDSSFRHLLRTRFLISKLFSDPCYQNEIRLRDFKSIPMLFNAFQNEKTNIINLNWDDTIKNAFASKNFVYLHGSIQYPETLVFPTEEAADRHKIIEAMVSEKVTDAIQELGKAHQISVGWFMKAKQIILWGVNINEYDFELNHFLKAYDEKEWIVINPSVQPAFYLSYINDMPVTHINPLTNVKTIIKANTDNFFELIYCGNKIRRSKKTENLQPDLSDEYFNEIKKINRTRLK